ILCHGESTGALDITIDTTVGVPPYTINVVNTDNSFDYGTQTTGLPAGNYLITLTDDKGCFVTRTAFISQPDEINYTISSVAIQCDVSGGVTTPGSITVSDVTGGTAEYTFLLTSNNGSLPEEYTTTPGNRDHIFEILEFGIYQIDVYDSNGCATYSTQIISSPPDDLDIDVTA